MEYDNVQAGITQRKDLAASPGIAMEVTRKGEADGSVHKRRSKKKPTPEGWASKRKPGTQLCESPVVALCESPVVVLCESPVVVLCESPVVPLCESPVVPLCESPVVVLCESPVVVLCESPVVVSATGDVQPMIARLHTTAEAIRNDFIVFMVLAEYELN
jgi:hypothetical protein